MNQQKKQSCVLFRTVVEAAKEMNKEDALELLLTYADYALGDTEDIETDNKFIKLILKQTVPALIAAENRYVQAVENGLKGKDAGVKGKDFGKRGGRPRTGETKEEAYKRRNSQNPPENPGITPQNNIEETPQKTPLDVDVYVDKDVYVEEDIDKDIYIDKYKNLPWEEYLKLFVNKYPSINYELDFPVFTSTYRDILEAYQKFIYDNTGEYHAIEYLTFHLTYYAKFGKVNQYKETNA